LGLGPTLAPQIPGKQFQTMQIQIDALLLKAEKWDWDTAKAIL
jgi:hypothetical protein